MDAKWEGLALVLLQACVPLACVELGSLGKHKIIYGLSSQNGGDHAVGEIPDDCFPQNQSLRVVFWVGCQKPGLKLSAGVCSPVNPKNTKLISCQGMEGKFAVAYHVPGRGKQFRCACPPLQKVRFCEFPQPQHLILCLMDDCSVLAP